MSDDLESLGVKLVDQSSLEQKITRKANQVMLAKDKELDEKRLEKANKELSKVLDKVRILQRRLGDSRTKISQRKMLRDQIRWLEENELDPVKRDVNDIQARLRENREESGQSGGVSGAGETAVNTKSEQLPGESERDYLIRIGKITAFGNENVFHVEGAADSGARGGSAGGADVEPAAGDPMSHVNLRAPGFAPSGDSVRAAPARIKQETPVASRSSDEPQSGPGSAVTAGGVSVKHEVDDDAGIGSPEEIPTGESADEAGAASGDSDDGDDAYVDDGAAAEEEEGEDDQYTPGDPDAMIDSEIGDDGLPVLVDGTGSPGEEEEEEEDLRNVDDGDETLYQARLGKWVSARSRGRQQEGGEAGGASDDIEEWYKPHPTIPDATLNDQFKLPGDIYPALFDYQKTCVQWLWELYSQRNGGIIGDEMGLGKTVQVISFIAGLHYSGLLDKPVLVVVPATVLNQWVNEFHRWWPPLRCVILHSIGTGMIAASKQKKKSSEQQLEEYLEKLSPTEGKRKFGGSGIGGRENPHVAELIDRVFSSGHVLVTTYVGLRIYSRYLLPREWGYVVLDEGHKIRNPDSDISLCCKQLKTPNRIILSGTPIQNNLIELWSLFDFVFPGRLGTLPVFQQQFAIPINMGGYANASNVQVQTGYKCAVVLRDLISPYLLRRLKSDVAQDLPKKSEMVLFVKLTQLQQEMYEKFLSSEDIHAILKGKRNLLMGVDILRKICNHPDLVDRDILMRKRDYHYGDPMKSGKMLVLKNLLDLWKTQGHRTLLFCQTRQMLDILENFVADMGFNYLRMDGSTPITNRQGLVDTFNEDLQFHVFLLTTKVGGLGVNLTGADRVIIYDPDWNPSTDIQARERAWRLGQKKDITIYRLMTAGSIEEKIYHRQIFKTFLTNKILKDPKQRRFFKMNDLHDLFTLGDPDEVGTETGDLFDGSEQKFGGTVDRKSSKLFKPKHKNDDDFYQVAGLNGVSKLDKFEGDDDDEDDDDGEKAKGEGDKKAEDDTPDDENRIMEGLFSNSGVHSALKHDEIMDSSKHELSIIEREATKIASQAAEALKQSRRLARKTKIGTPTWTGKFGLAGKFGKTTSRIGKPGIAPTVQLKKGSTQLLSKTKNNNNSPLSSASVLSELRSKKGMDKFSFANSRSPSPSTSSAAAAPNDKHSIIQSITDYLNSQPENFSTSTKLLDAVKQPVSEQKDLVIMRSILREVADWDATRKGWILKEEFKK